MSINGAASGGGPGDAHCTLTNPSSFPAPGVIAFEAPAGAGSCPQLAAETIYFVVIEWVDPSGTGSFALIPQTYPTEETAATEEGPGRCGRLVDCRQVPLSRRQFRRPDLDCLR